MSWYKRAQFNDFKDRNQFNGVIHKLHAFADTLRYAAKLIYMTGRGARQVAAEVAGDKALSSFPPIRDILAKADRLALDNPHKFAHFCEQAAEMLTAEAIELEEKRHEFLEGDKETTLKGIVDDV